jgi:tetratricopeptide (TPR) repeat protein
MMTDCLSGHIFLHYLEGEFDLAIIASQAAWDLSEKIDNLWGKSYSQLYIGNVHFDLGHISSAIEVMQTSIELGRKSGFVVPGAVLPARIALIYANMGAQDEALNSIADAAAGRSEYTLPFIKQIEAEIHVLANDPDRAQMLIEEISNTPHMIGTLALLLPLEITKAMCAFALGNYQHVLSLLEGSINVALARGTLALLPRMYYYRALALNSSGQASDALAQVNAAVDLTMDSGARWDTWQLLALRAELERKAGLLKAAEDDHNAARQIICYIADHAGDEILAASFLARTDVAAILNFPS